MSDETVSFDYRLPVTFVRVTGTRTETGPADALRTSCQSAVTTETRSDTRTRCPVVLGERARATQKATWNLTPDGRLTGADIATTVAPFAGLKVALQAGSMVAGALGPSLLAAGPPGWVALAGAAGVAAVGGGVLARAFQLVGDPEVVGVEAVGAPDDASPADYDIDERYDEAVTLANLRDCLRQGADAHAQAVRAAVLAQAPGEEHGWAERVGVLRRMLASAQVGAAQAEARYTAWLAEVTPVQSHVFDVQLPVDLLPTSADLATWARTAGEDGGNPGWAEMLERLHVAVSVDLDEHDALIDVDLHLVAEPTGEIVHYRPARQALVQVWKAIPDRDNGRLSYDLALHEVRRVPVACPGNERQVNISTDHSTHAVAVTFDESGALTKVTTSLEDPVIARSAGASALLSSVGDAVASGQSIRGALSGPSLVEQAAEAKAAGELGLVPSTVDPLKALRNQVAEEQLRAQLKLAEQMQAATSIPVFVSVG